MRPILLSIIALLAPTFAVDPLVDLGYSKYRGTEDYGIIRWAGMRYARSPSRLEGLRFAAPQDPEPNSTIQDADHFRPICIGTRFNLTTELGGDESEDCLFVNVFAPAHANTSSLLPVFVFIQGGGFDVNGNANYNGSDLIAAAGTDLVVVNFNYRVGPYGFLASKEIASNSSLSLNNGLKDQRQVLKWVNSHIQQFGGDPNHVVLGGASAGAGSVVLHLTAYGGRNDSLFQAAAAESQAFPGLRTISESQFEYDALLKAAGCKNLQCLQNMDAVTFQQAVLSLKDEKFPGAPSAPVYLYNPVIDDDFIKDYTYAEINAGHFVKVPTIFGDTTNEGIIFTPSNITSRQMSDNFIQNQYPELTSSDLTKIRAVFPGPTNQDNDPNWRNQSADVYGHIRYICPGMNASNAYYTHNQTNTWNYRWNVGAAKHVAELGSIWFNGTSASGVFIHNYFASFMRTYEPNDYRHEFFETGSRRNRRDTITAPTWEQWGGGNGKRMLFDDNNVVQMENVPQDEINKCAVINSLGVHTNQLSAATLSSSPSVTYLFYGVQMLVALLLLA